MHSSKRTRRNEGSTTPSGSRRHVHGAIQLLTQLRRSAASPSDKDHADADIELPTTQAQQTKRQMRPLTVSAPAIDEGDAFSIAYGGRDRRDASGKTFRVRVPKKLLLWVGVIFFGLPILLFLYVEGSRFIFNRLDSHQQHDNHVDVHHQEHHNKMGKGMEKSGNQSHLENGKSTSIGGTNVGVDAEVMINEQSSHQQEPEGVDDHLAADDLVGKVTTGGKTTNETTTEENGGMIDGNGSEQHSAQNDSEKNVHYDEGKPQ